VVQIHKDQGHTVVTDGPYRWLRHPGYAGAALVYAATPLILGSWWAFIPSAITLVVIVIRTALEDKTLRAELPGYAEYAQDVRWRLLPGIW
jgi:protein-S-isoprenylcysteine O-methyltransferase Ste14